MSGEVVDITSAVLKFVDPHQALAILTWCKVNGIYPPTEIDGPLTDLRKNLQVAWAYTELGVPLDKAAEDKAASQLELCNALEKKHTSFFQCLLEHKKESMNNTEGRSDRRPVAEINTLWQRKAEDLRQARNDSTDPEEREAIDQALLAYEPFSANVITDMLPYIRAYYEGGDYRALFFRSRFCLECMCDVVSEAAQDENSREEFLWGAILAACMQLRPGVNDAGIDFGTVPQYILQLDELYDEQRPSTGAAGANRLGGEKRSLLQTAWLLHWALWVLFRFYFGTLAVSGRQAVPRNTVWSELVDWFLSEKAQQCIGVVAPHLLRYYAVVAILNRKREDHARIAAQAVSNGNHRYQDPITRLVTSSFIDCNFDQSQVELPVIADLCREDFFLVDLADEVEEQARLLVFDNYCRIHRSININMLSDKLHMPSDKAEKWIVNLIRDAKLDAKIDSEKNIVEMASHVPNCHAQILDKTRDLIFRSHALVHALQSRTR